jgi:NHLM bacteriocin system ABC transporter peptidase/ATP-binding protein
MEATECGAAALAIVLEYHGTFVPLAQLREECGVSRDGSKASNILKAARVYGLEARGYRKEPNTVAELPLPAILHWNFNHFLVVEGFGRGRVFLNDPAAGPVSVSDEEFDRSFTGVALTFVPTAEYRPRGRRPSLLPSLMRRLEGSRSALSFVVLAGLLLVVPGLVAPAFGLVFVDHVLVANRVDWLPGLLLGLAGTALVRAALTRLQRGQVLRLATKLGVGSASQFLWHVLRLPIGFYSARSPGDLAGRVQLNDTVAHTLSGPIAGVFLDLVLVAFYGALMLAIDPLLTSIGVATVIGHLVLMRSAERLRQDGSRRVALYSSKLSGVAAGGLMMIETTKGAGLESELFAQWAGYQAKLANARQELERKDQLIYLVAGLLGQASSLAVLGVGALRVMDGHLTLGMLVAFQGLMAAFVSPVESVARVGASLHLLSGALERLDDVLGHERDPVLADGAVAEAPRRLRGAIELSDITFGYLPFSPPLVRELSLTLAPGQRVALVGGTGSGKSTVAKLVTGLHAPQKGEIRFDGKRREEHPRPALVASIAMVDQDVSLFDGTVRDNLTLWDETVPEADVVQAAKDACIHEDITRLPGGYSARVAEGGVNFSGGQRQRLEIARALVRRPSIVVLDEATSALDPETERRVDENLRRRGCTCLVIAHRLSTVRDADEILVLERGLVVERGTHEALLARGGVYRELIATA